MPGHWRIRRPGAPRRLELRMTTHRGQRNGTAGDRASRPLPDFGVDVLTVILTADHGHVIERRRGIQRPYPAISSARSRPVTPPAGEGEILVSGERVLLHEGSAVLAVDEDLRYGQVKSRLPRRRFPRRGRGPGHDPGPRCRPR
jgi:hypothetical protein